jgi:hypothetical protein
MPEGERGPRDRPHADRRPRSTLHERTFWTDVNRQPLRKPEQIRGCTANFNKLLERV